MMVTLQTEGIGDDVSYLLSESISRCVDVGGIDG